MKVFSRNFSEQLKFSLLQNRIWLPLNKHQHYGNQEFLIDSQKTLMSMVVTIWHAASGTLTAIASRDSMKTEE